jgi:hypothetical protein
MQAAGHCSLQQPGAAQDTTVKDLMCSFLQLGFQEAVRNQVMQGEVRKPITRKHQKAYHPMEITLTLQQETLLEPS